MDATQFAYWLQGFFEISDARNLDYKQVQIIRDHLNLVFNKVTPQYDKFGTPVTTCELRHQYCTCSPINSDNHGKVCPQCFGLKLFDEVNACMTSANTSPFVSVGTVDIGRAGYCCSNAHIEGVLFC
jgi:hypothetical protein